jgi:redox-sensitive bicupin YhaK (pirin superfamily)
MMQLRKANDRGHANHGWLDSYHSFSFADYYDPQHMGFGPLRVINEDRVAAGQGFGTHAHRDMEIISYVLEGELAHKDSMGNGSVIRPGDVQRMSAGTGVRHSEYNHLKTGGAHFLQIWIMPDRAGAEPGYQEAHFPDTDKDGRLRLVVSKDGRDGSVSMNQDALLYAGLFDGGQSASYALPAGRLGYVHVARGKVAVNGQPLEAGDALMLEAVDKIDIGGGEKAEVLLFDLPR